ncbi:MAG: deoxyguanosinetriphosphate triphosphohydrolase [bacterium]
MTDPTTDDSLRKRYEASERTLLAPQAAKAADSRGRRKSEPPCPVRTAYQQDRDRVIHSKAFRRLAHKTQVFLSPEGDHYRTRITHTLEVSQIARTIARGLRLNEDLTEAIAMGHDLGHTPFGHGGEAVLNELLPGGFRHYQQSLRVVDELEKDGRGLNLTDEVRDGIVRHSKGKGPILTTDPARLPGTLEGQVVRLADIIAYLNHDLDDALRGKVIDPGEVPAEILDAVGRTTSDRIAFMVTDVLQSTDFDREERVLCSDTTHDAIHAMRAFLYERLYENPVVHEPFDKVRGILTGLWGAYLGDLDRFFEITWPDCPASLRATPERSVGDFLASMTDRYALRLWQEMFIPRRWSMM